MPAPIVNKGRICSINGCAKNAGRAGYCHMHYWRITNNGHPDIRSKKKRKFELALEFIAALPLEGSGCVEWPFKRNSSGYGCIARNAPNTKTGRTTSIASRLVCERVHGPAPTTEHQAAHSCGRGHLGCVAPWHLSWKTPLENSREKHAHGTTVRGSKHTWAKLSEEKVAEILKLRGVISQDKIAAKFGVTQHVVSLILLGRAWKHVPRAA